MLPETACTYYIELQGDNFVSVGPGGQAICGNKVTFKGFGQ
jgi:hypothetical protein